MTTAAPPVFVAAVGWTEHGFEVATADAAAATDDAVEPFRTPLVSGVQHHLVQLWARFGDRLRCVVDSTNGMLDGGLMSLGLDVYRADPTQLPARPVLGSVPAGALARAAVRRPQDLTRLVLTSGSLTGRFPETAADALSAADELAGLTAVSRCMSHGPRALGPRGPSVALTFDDGPHPPYTDAVLATLTHYGVPATFFCVGLHALAHRDLLRRIAGSGHELGNHTWSHPLLTDLDHAQARAQLDRTDELLGSAAGAGGPALFRPPYGAVNESFVRWFRDDPAGRSMVLWDVEPDDWAQPGSARISRRVLADVSPGSVVLLHDGGGDRSQTVDALPAVIEGLVDRGYTFATVSGLLGPG